MGRTEGMADARGARDLLDLWRGLPVAGFRYSADDLPEDITLQLASLLRAWAWRDHCIAPTRTACADARRSCAMTGTGRCRADAALPVNVGGGAASWRMASLVPQWLPRSRELRLIALGETACDLLGWAARRLSDHADLNEPEPLGVSTFADLELQPARRWHFRIVTPWLVDKRSFSAIPAPGGAAPEHAVMHELCKAMRVRGHKFTALCARDERLQRLGSHLAHHVADTVLAGGLAMGDLCMEVAPLGLLSRGNGSRFQALGLSGEAILSVAPPVLPWLSLVALCGGGENADKGFGGVELVELD